MWNLVVVKIWVLAYRIHAYLWIAGIENFEDKTSSGSSTQNLPYHYILDYHYIKYIKYKTFKEYLIN